MRLGINRSHCAEYPNAINGLMRYIRHVPEWVSERIFCSQDIDGMLQIISKPFNGQIVNGPITTLATATSMVQIETVRLKHYVGTVVRR